MARPSSVVRVVIVGALPNGEQFQTGCWVQYSLPGPTLAELQEYANAAAAAAEAIPLGSHLTGTDVLYQELRAYDYSLPGPAPATQVAVAPLGYTGGSVTTDEQPNQIAMVATLRTGMAGRSRRGRMYWPANHVEMSSHQFTQGDIEVLADGVRDWFDALNNAPGLINPRVSVVSTTLTATFPITAVEVDSRADVQRRRAESETELRQSTSALVTP